MFRRRVKIGNHDEVNPIASEEKRRKGGGRRVCSEEKKGIVLSLALLSGKPVKNADAELRKKKKKKIKRGGKGKVVFRLVGGRGGKEANCWKRVQFFGKRVGDLSPERGEEKKERPVAFLHSAVGHERGEEGEEKARKFLSFTFPWAEKKEKRKGKRRSKFLTEEKKRRKKPPRTAPRQ